MQMTSRLQTVANTANKIFSFVLGFYGYWHSRYYQTSTLRPENGVYVLYSSNFELHLYELK